MKKLTTLTLSIALTTLALAGCASSGTTTQTNQPNNVGTTNVSTTTQNTNNQQQNQSLAFQGSITGNDANVYKFTAQRGQVLRVLRKNTSPNIQLSLQYLGDDTESSQLSGDFQVLPYTGQYQLTVGQTRNDARKNPNAELNYDLIAYIENQRQGSNTQNVTYRCDNNQTLTVNYRGNTATTNIGGINQNLNFERQYSQPNNPVYSNNDYSMSVGTVDTGNFAQSTIYSLTSYKNSVDGRILLQNCQVN